MQLKCQHIIIDLYGPLDENDFINSILTCLTQIESKLERILKRLPGLKVTGSFDPVTGLPTLSASIKSRETPQFLEKALRILESYTEKQKLLLDASSKIIKSGASMNSPPSAWLSAVKPTEKSSPKGPRWFVRKYTIFVRKYTLRIVITEHPAL